VEDNQNELDDPLDGPEKDAKDVHGEGNLSRSVGD
jgi:hypothetical protein